MAKDLQSQGSTNVAEDFKNMVLTPTPNPSELQQVIYLSLYLLLYQRCIFIILGWRISPLEVTSYFIGTS